MDVKHFPPSGRKNKKNGCLTFHSKPPGIIHVSREGIPTRTKKRKKLYKRQKKLLQTGKPVMHGF
ncbi:MAG: hypothetical protein B5M56_08450 [Desulfococcus sp. 4484_241]|nr:MAG: hypothetical protein B5M56_08450 [Desulfococcus sp. 4484_241]